MSTPSIVVATDFSDQAGHAVSHAVAIAKAQSARLVLVHALSMPDSGYPVPYSFSIPEAYLDFATEIREKAKAKLELERQRLEALGLSVIIRCEVEMPDRAILAAASACDASLIVVGSHGRKGLARFLLGSVAEQVARHAECDVLVARGPVPELGYQHILVPTDLSDVGEQVLAQAISLAAENSTIDLFYCWELPGVPVNYWGSTDFGLGESIRKGAQDYGQALVKKFANENVSLKFSAERGDIRHGIEDATKNSQVDLVVMGSHHRTGVERLLLGSVAETTLRHVAQSVYITRKLSK